MAETILRVAGVNKRFGGLQALSNVGLEIERGQIYGLIGPNGAGKTTFFNVITGLYAPDSGTFELAGKPYSPSYVHKVAEAGIARTFQNIRLFPDMTALENVMVGRHVRTKATALGAILRTRSTVNEERQIKQRALELLEYVGIRKYADYQARTLAYGDQRRLEIARALATEPKLLALDEPAAGMNATEKMSLRGLLENISRDGITILLIEHDVKLVMGLCDRVTVLDYGKMIAVGDPDRRAAQPRGDRGLPRRRPYERGGEGRGGMTETVLRPPRASRSPVWAAVRPTPAPSLSLQRDGACIGRSNDDRCRPSHSRPEGGLWRHSSRQGRRSRDPCRRARHADRRQRRRQDDDAEGDHRHAGVGRRDRLHGRLHARQGAVPAARPRGSRWCPRAAASSRG